MLLARCAGERVGVEDRPLTDERRRAILADVDRLARDAYRTLGVATRQLDADLDRPIRPTPTGSSDDLVWLGLVGIIDPPRAEAAAAIADAHAPGSGS